MKNETVLLYNVSYNQGLSYWSIQSKWEDPNFPAVLIDHFQTELENTNGDLELILLRASAFVQDILNLKKILQDKVVLLDFVQFHACTLILSYLAKNKYFSYCFDWINNSISDSVSTEKLRDFYPFRIEGILQSKEPYIQSEFDDCFAKWSHDLFYYSRCTGGHNELAKEFFRTYFSYFTQAALKHQTIEYCGAIGQASIWCRNHQFAEFETICCRALFEIYQASTNNDIKKMIAFQFSCSNHAATGLTKRQWCKIVQHQYKTSLKGHEEFQMLLNLYEGDLVQILEHFTEIIESIQNYAKQDLASAHELHMYHRSRIFSILERLISTLVANGHIERANQIIGAYFSIPENKLIQSTNAYIIPNKEYEVQYCFEKNVLVADADTKKNLPSIIALENSFLGNTHTFNDNINFKIEAPKREGVPDSSYANAFYSCLSEHMSVGKILGQQNLDRCNGYFLLYGSQLSIQPIISKEIGITIPIIHSFLEPLKARKLKKVFVWQGYTQMAEKERVGLGKVFDKFGIQMVSKDCFFSSKAEFIENYSNEQYDAFWILGHGEFLHHESHKSFLDLGNDIKISIAELKSISFKSDERRLLIIDACDGATTSLSNSPAAIGIGTSMISEHQSLVSHAWPVENVPSLILGILFSILLCQGNSYAAAHSRTINLFYQGKEVVLDFIRKFCSNSEVIERIENNTFDYQNFYYWGSLVFVI